MRSQLLQTNRLTSTLDKANLHARASVNVNVNANSLLARYRDMHRAAPSCHNADGDGTRELAFVCCLAKRLYGKMSRTEIEASLAAALLTTLSSNAEAES